MSELRLESVSTGYFFPTQAISDISISVTEGGIAALIGPNGAGKSTTLSTISGLLKPWQGRVLLDGQSIGGKSLTAIVKIGIAQVPEGRRILPGLTVGENLSMGGYTVNDRQKFQDSQDRVFKLFPVLRERLKQLGGTLSGGEQQMLAIGRALMSQPKFLLLDEPSMGLAPVIVERIFQHIVTLKEQGLGILLVEQNANLALEVSDRAYVLERGRIRLSGPSQELLSDPQVQKSYLGV